MHIEKFKCNQISAILGHLKREHIHYNNENVDLSKSNNNVCFLKRDMEYFNKRMSELYVYGGWNEKHKAKYNAMASIAVHCPKGIDSEVFFSMMNDVLCKKYGDENVLCSIVHKDEKRDHMHFSFIPVVYNEKKKQYQLSYEKCLAHDFKTFHSDIEKALKEEFGIDVKLHEEENQNKFYFDKIEDYKKYKDIEESLKNIINNNEIQIKTMSNELETISKEIVAKQNELEEINQMSYLDTIKYNGYKNKKEIEECKQKIMDLQHDLQIAYRYKAEYEKIKDEAENMKKINAIMEINDSAYNVQILENFKMLYPDMYKVLKYNSKTHEKTLNNIIDEYSKNRELELAHKVIKKMDSMDNEER